MKVDVIELTTTVDMCIRVSGHILVSTIVRMVGGGT